MSDSNDKNYTFAKESDGTIQITFTIAKEIISENQKRALEELGKDIEVPGFRKGNAPMEKVKDSVSKEKLIEKTLSGVLPKMLSETLIAEKIKPSIYPKFELVSVPEDGDWQVRAHLCEIPPFDLNDYKTKIKGVASDAKIWTPEKGNSEEKDEKLTRSEKEQKIIEFLLTTIKPTVPKILIDEEVNSRLSQLLSRTEKLGLTLEGYLSSIGKTPQTLRDEYIKQSEEAIRLELILEKIALEEKISVSDNEIDEAVKASSSDPTILDKVNTPEQRSYIKTILSRRKALDFLLSLL